MSDIDESLLGANFAEIGDEKVSLPLSLVVNSVRPEELSKRTTKVERDPELNQMPDVFSLSGMADGSLESTEPVEDVLSHDRLPTEETTLSDDRRTIPFTPSSRRMNEAEEVDVKEEVAELPQVDESNVNGDADEPAEDVGGFDIPESIPLAMPEKSNEASESVEQEERPVEAAAFTGFEIPESTPLERPDDLAASVMDPAPAGHPSMEDLDRMMREAEAPSVPPAAVEAPISVDAPAASFEEAEQEVATDEVLVNGLDVNHAGTEDMVVRMNGIGPRLAIRIVEDRELNGRFTDVYDLARVQGIGKKIFETITGLNWREDLCGRREILSNILDSSKDTIPDIKGVAARVSDTKGFEGCVIVHSEGYVLASSWEHTRNEALGAFAPQMFKKVVQYIRRLELGEMDAFTYFFDDFPITLVSHGDIILAAIHTPNRFSRRHVQIARALTSELSRRLQRMRDF